MIVTFIDVLTIKDLVDKNLINKQDIKWIKDHWEYKDTNIFIDQIYNPLGIYLKDCELPISYIETENINQFIKDITIKFQNPFITELTMNDYYISTASLCDEDMEDFNKLRNIYFDVFSKHLEYYGLKIDENNKIVNNGI